MEFMMAEEGLGVSGTFFLFGIVSIIGAIFVFGLVKETKGLTDLAKKTLYVTQANIDAEAKRD